MNSRKHESTYKHMSIIQSLVCTFIIPINVCWSKWLALLGALNSTERIFENEINSSFWRQRNNNRKYYAPKAVLEYLLFTCRLHVMMKENLLDDLEIYEMLMMWGLNHIF